MNKALFSLLFLVLSGFAVADSSCENIPGELRYSLETWDGAICIVEQDALDQKNNPGGVDTVVYTITKGNKPIKAEGGELFNDGGRNPGIIYAVFPLDINQEGKEEIIVMQYIEVRSSIVEPNSSGTFYDVMVF
jgi:hypothetical protein